MATKTYQDIPIDEWTSLECYEWADSVRKRNYFNLNGSETLFWTISGRQLLGFREEDFNGLVPGYGDVFQQEFQTLLENREMGTTLLNHGTDDLIVNPTFPDENSSPVYTELRGPHHEHQTCSSTSSDMSECVTSPGNNDSSSIEYCIDILMEPHHQTFPEDIHSQCEDMCFQHSTNNHNIKKSGYKYEAFTECHQNSNSPQLLHTQTTKFQVCEKSVSTSEEKLTNHHKIRRHSLRNPNKINYAEDITSDLQHIGKFSLPNISNSFLLQKIPTKTKKRDRGPKNWEFLVRLLVNENTNPSLIKWEDRATFTFRIVQSRSVAKLWGSRSDKEITYENFARGLRYHYTTNALNIVSKKKLVYRCGEKAVKYLNELESGVA